MESFWIRAVDSRNKVSFGGSLWKTTLEMDDLPLLWAEVSDHNALKYRALTYLRWPISNRRGFPLGGTPIELGPGVVGFCASVLDAEAPLSDCSKRR